MHSDLIKEKMEQELKSVLKPLINGIGLSSVIGIIATEVENMNDEKGDDISIDWEVAASILDTVTETLDFTYEDTIKGGLARKDNLTYLQHRVDCLVDDHQ